MIDKRELLQRIKKLSENYPEAYRNPSLTEYMEAVKTVINLCDNEEKPTEEKSEEFHDIDREWILKKAASCVLSDRNDIYGEPEYNFCHIADLWNAYCGDIADCLFDARDVAVMMILFKVARLENGNQTDSWVDIAGYAACGGEIDWMSSKKINKRGMRE